MSNAGHPLVELKRAIVLAVCERLEHEASAARRAADAAHEAATHEEAKPENDKDTRSVEAAYLAGAQASRASAAQGMLAQLRALALKAFDHDSAVESGALCSLESDNRRVELMVLPAGGGVSVEVDGRRYQTTTPQSPLGAALLGAVATETVEIETPAGLKEYLVVRVQ